jgi:hypothetical protein
MFDYILFKESQTKVSEIKRSLNKFTLEEISKGGISEIFPFPRRVWKVPEQTALKLLAEQCYYNLYLNFKYSEYSVHLSKNKSHLQISNIML